MKHVSAAILSIGDELTLGQGLDTNSQWLSQQLVAMGIAPVEHTTVPDSAAATRDAMIRLAAGADLLIVTGGLGPTADDLTRESLAAAMDDALIEDPESLKQVIAWFVGRSRPMPELNRVQALRPSRAASLSNGSGTAPGMQGIITTKEKETDVFCLPGPPREMRAMWEAHVRGALRPARVVRTRAVLTFGMGESEVAATLGPMMARTHSPLVGTTASGGVIAVRIRFEGAVGKTDAAAVEEADHAVADIEATIRQRLGPIVFGTDEQTLASVILERLKADRQTLATVESCTGGLLGEQVTEVAGSSTAYIGGWVTYSNEMKQGQVGVRRELFGAGGPGAVSREVAEAMARGGLDRSGADWCLSITGIAGPDGGTPDKPVGTVWIGLAWRQSGLAPGIESRQFAFTGERANIRDWSAKSALAMLRLRLVGSSETRLLRQVD